MKSFRTILAYDYSLAEVLVEKADEFEQKIATELWPNFLQDIAARRFTEILTAEEMQSFDQVLSEVLNIPSAKEAVTPKLLKIRRVFLPSLIQTLEELYPEAKKLITRYKIERQSSKDEPFSYRDYAEGLIRAKKKGNPRLYERFYERLRKEVARTEDEQKEGVVIEEVEEDFNPVEAEKDLQNVVNEGANYYIEQPQLQQRWLETARNHITRSFQQGFGVRHIVRTLRDLLERFKKQLPNTLYEKAKKAQLKRNYDYGGDHLDRIRNLLRKKRRRNRAKLVHSLQKENKSYEDYLERVQQNGLALQDVPEELRTPELCKLAVQQDGLALEDVPEELRTPELYKLAVQQDGWALKFVPEELRTYKLSLEAVKSNSAALLFVPKEYREELKRIVLEKPTEAPSDKQIPPKAILQKQLRSVKVAPIVSSVFDLYVLNYLSFDQELFSKVDQKWLETLFRETAKEVKQFYVKNLDRELKDEVKTTQIPQFISNEEARENPELLKTWYSIKMNERWKYNPQYIENAPSYDDYISLFMDIEWEDQYGGPAWGKIAYLTKKLSRALSPREIVHIIDIINNIAHNTGSILNKFDFIKDYYEVVLNSKASENSISIMYPYCSGEVRRLLKDVRFLWRRGSLIRRLRALGSSRNYPDPFLQVLLKEYRDGVSIKELARRYNTSPYKLIKRFKDMGYVKPPTQRIPKTKEDFDKEFMEAPSELQMLKDEMLSKMKERKELQARLKNLRKLLG